MTAQDVAKQADEASLRLVRFLWCGNDATIRAKSSARHGLEDRLGAGIGLTVAMQMMNLRHRGGATRSPSCWSTPRTRRL